MVEAKPSTFRITEVQCIHLISALFSFLRLQATPLQDPFVFKTLGNKRTIHQLSGELSGSKFLIPTHVSQAFPGTPALTVFRKTTGWRQKALWGLRANHVNSSSGKATGISVCARTCVYVYLRTLDKFVLGSIWFVDTAFSPRYPAVFLAFGNWW